MSEFELIREIAGRVKPRADVLLGIGDDCAILAPPKGKRLALSTDTLVAGVHFFADTESYLIGYKALAVNLSDLAAMGAKPLWYSMALTLPTSDANFAHELTRGMHTLSVDQSCYQTLHTLGHGHRYTRTAHHRSSVTASKEHRQEFRSP